MATDPNDSLADLTPPDQLSLLIGRACQLDVDTEWELGHIFATLTFPTPARLLVPSSFDQLVKSIRIMIADLLIPAVWKQASTIALDAAHAAHRGRNEWVHDKWVYVPLDDKPDHVHKYTRPKKDPLITHAKSVPLADLKDLVERLRRANTQIATLGVCLNDVVHNRHVEGGHSMMTDEFLPMVRGEL